MTLLSVHAAQERLLAHFKPVETETLPLMSCSGRVLAEEVMAIDLPGFDNSSVDGFAVMAGDVRDASPTSPRTLRVVADIPAGASPAVALASGEAARIMTGAPIPAGADAIVMVEDTDFHQRRAGAAAPSSVKVFKAVQRGENIRTRGMDVRAGEKILPVGHALRPQDLGVLAMLGKANVKVYRRPRLALLSSGDELVDVDAPLPPGKIRDANSYILSTLTREAGGEVLPLGIVSDHREAIRARLNEAVEQQADILVSSAGVSVGAFDFVREVVETEGELDFWRVNMRPGKPLAFGRYRGIPFIGLPGNPVSAFVGFEVFVRPALEQLAGRERTSRPRIRVKLAEPVESDGRESYLRAVLEEREGTFYARLSGHQGSGNLLSLVRANALLIIPAGVKSLPIDAQVEAWWL